ncbi:uncharacterized protein LOC129959110 [Argiope bruennichi]|uniref:Uncharacterized protein n=1 Tax=Argiope bruennichi TaxID=94029 RepID=A0A8T0F7M6_ARGBR|nr:uncharacterized protein LOC129959110 [Argiope bruennichi]KAF8785420.1 hypothetical protein HNY73_010959 [Argiope bruennichi]
MANIHCQLLFATILYGLVFVGSIIVISSLAYAKSSNDGKCYLYIRKDTKEPSELPCSIIIYSSGAATMYALVMAIYHGYGTIVASRESHIGRTMWVMPWLLINSFAVVMIFICACVYSIGFHITCSFDKEFAFTGCEKFPDYKTKFVCEISGWINLLLWSCLVAIEGVRLARNRRARSREVYVDPSASDVVSIGNIVPTA